MKRGAVFVVFFVFLFCADFASAAITARVVDETVSVNSLLLRVSLREGQTVTKSLTIGGTNRDAFVLEVVSVPGVGVSESNFVVGSNEKKNVDVFFNTNNLRPGVYVGSLEIIGTTERVSVPIIFEVESAEVLFDVTLDIPPAYVEVAPGSKLIFQVKVFDLLSGGVQEGSRTSAVDMKYVVFDSAGKIVSSEEERLIVEERAQATRTIAFPENIGEGNYIVSTIATFNDSVGVSSQAFSIRGANQSIFSFDFSNLQFIIVLVFVGLVVLICVLIFVYLSRSRDRLILEMKRYNSSELARVRSFLIEQQNLIKRRGAVSKNFVKTNRQKRISLSKQLHTKDNLHKEVNHKLEKLRKRQNERVREMERLKKKGNTAFMERKLQEWKSQGYTMTPLEYKMKGLNDEEMKYLLDKWKSKYKK